MGIKCEPYFPQLRINEMRILFSALALVLLVGCATPATVSDIPLEKHDENTRYGVEQRSNGFGISVAYSRYQFVPESDAVATACKQALTSLAWDHADSVGREIEPINEQRIRISMGRNGVTGITSCRAYAVASWK